MREEFFGKKILVFGYGISGKGAEFALKECGAIVTVLTDAAGFDISLEPDFDLIIVSPSIDKRHRIWEFAKARNIEIYGEIELGARLFSGKIVAVTGTNGKTTVVRLIGEILKRAGIRAAVCGNVGVSFARAALESGAEVAVVEVSSFQLEQIVSFRPFIAAVTNITADHLDRHGSMENYAGAKLRIAENQREEDRLILSDEIPIAYLCGFYPKSQLLLTGICGKTNGAYLRNGTLYYLDEPILKRESVRLLGDHNVQNALAAIAVCKLLGADNAAIVETLSVFTPDNHRIQFVGRYKGKNYYNDSKGTNTGATLAACGAMTGLTALLLGGKEKNCPFFELFQNLPDFVAHIFAFGETAERMKREAERYGKTVTVCPSLKEAVLAASRSAADTVLLSPATSSFDQFADYEERGKVFEKTVRELQDPQTV